MKVWTRRFLGFTIVELTIIIVVIGTLSAIMVVAYSGMQRRSAEATMISDLSNATSILERSYMANKVYPSTLPSDVRTSPNVRLTVGASQYYNLSASQNALLFYNTCKQMVAQGNGKTTSNGGTVVDIVTDCLVYTHNGYFHVNGWSVYLGPDTVKMQVPISSTDLASKAAGITYYDPYYPNGTTVAKNFLTDLDQRYRSQGGTYPITQLWDEGGGSVPKPTLPALTPGGGYVTPSTYCIQARHLIYTDLTWYIKPEGKPTKGLCS